MTTQTTISHHEMLTFLESFLALGRVSNHPIWYVMGWLRDIDATFRQLHFSDQCTIAKRLMQQYQFDSLISWNDQERCWIVL